MTLEAATTRNREAMAQMAACARMTCLYLSTTTFLFGAQLDAIIRAQATGTLSGGEVDPSQRS
ncbi:MAG: hypothetical protein LC790_14805 [Actinobacteria bacterium]|nr:hypothetical protein [Actinomycetota bacterium]